ncbi:hypothetical protein GIB67_005117, partial [Kingdonia uniflora]
MCISPQNNVHLLLKIMVTLVKTHMGSVSERNKQKKTTLPLNTRHDSKTMNLKYSIKSDYNQCVIKQSLNELLGACVCKV